MIKKPELCVIAEGIVAALQKAMKAFREITEDLSVEDTI